MPTDKRADIAFFLMPTDKRADIAFFDADRQACRPVAIAF